MSRLARKPLVLPADTTVTVTDNVVVVKGPKGELKRTVPESVRIVNTPEGVRVEVANSEERILSAMQGLWVRLVLNMVIGVTQGFEKVLEIEGIGYKVAVKGREVVLEVGFSHDVHMPIPEGLDAVAEKNVLRVRGMDKEAVGGFAVKIRLVRPPEPYKGKGIRYQGEIIRRKAGKAAKSAG